MTTRIYWFSGTGNALAIARGLARRLDNAELVSIAAALKTTELQDPPDDGRPDCIGIVFPAYAFGEPRIVARFLERYPLPTDARYFLIVTPASNPGAAIPRTARALESRGATLWYARSINMPTNYIPFQSLEPAETQEKKFAAAEAQLDAIASDIRNGTQTSNRISTIMRWLYTAALKASMAAFPTMDKHFSTTADCNGCGLCARLCPVDNIRIDGGSPVWRHDCEHCLACYHWCPAQAIAFKGKTKKGQYRHPDVKAVDLCGR